VDVFICFIPQVHISLISQNGGMIVASIDNEKTTYRKIVGKIVKKNWLSFHLKESIISLGFSHMFVVAISNKLY
jgi:hypothetical protein